MKKIEFTIYDQRIQSAECILKKYQVPYNVQLIMAAEAKLVQFTTIVPNDIARDITPIKYHENEKARRYLIFTIVVFVGLSVVLRIISL